MNPESIETDQDTVQIAQVALIVVTSGLEVLETVMVIVPMEVTVGEVMTRMVAAFTLILMSLCIIAQISETMASREIEEGLDDVIDGYCKELNDKLNAYHQILE